LGSPNIVSVFDFGTTTEGHLYFVMEFVEGTTLHHLIKGSFQQRLETLLPEDITVEVIGVPPPSTPESQAA